jgi:hypothetical protein
VSQERAGILVASPAYTTKNIGKSEIKLYVVQLK